MKHVFVFLAICKFFSHFAQSPAHTNGLRTQVQLANGGTDLVISWDVDSSATGYNLYKRTYQNTGWGQVFASIPPNQFSYQDTAVSPGIIYEYRVIRTTATNGFGYACGTVDADIDYNPGRLILVVDDFFLPALAQEIDSLIHNIEADGWFVDTLQVNRNQTPDFIKGRITSIYNSDPNLVKSVFLLGHVPVPYSGEINPDGHPDHLGAWPADGYYGDINGTWTDASVNNTSAAAVRNQNIPGDGKFDQSVFQSGVELEVARVDFYDLPAFPESETQLMNTYLAKLSAFKTRAYIPQDLALVEDNFLGLAEGFAGSGYISTSPIVGIANCSDGNYSSLTAQDYLWSYGTGPGSYSSASGIVTTPDFSNSDFNSTFTMLFGSYFGDWDSQNNLLKASLASGKVLANSWSGRPYLYYHPMGVGENIGSCIRLSQNNTNGYLASTLGYFQRWVHIAQLGDPTLRAHYVEMPGSLMASTLPEGTISLSWLAPAVAVEGFHVYRRENAVNSWTKLTNLPIQTTTYTDASVPNGGQFTYMVRSARKQTTGSGRYWNQSLGIQTSALATVGYEGNAEFHLTIWPNPTSNYFKFNAPASSFYSIVDLQGRKVLEGRTETPMTTIHVEGWKSGVYILHCRNRSLRFVKQ
jgi:hypothetical protein